MDNIKRRFESESKTRINLIGPSKCGKSTLVLKLIKGGIFDDSQYVNTNIEELNSIFSTEILCTGPRTNEVVLYLELKNREDLLSDIKYNILNNLDEAFTEIISSSELNTVNSERNNQNNFFNIFQKKMKNNYEIPLNRFFAKDNLRQVFAHVNFEMLFEELNKENDSETVEIHDNGIWNKYFDSFLDDYNNKYKEWINKINKYYSHSQCGCRYVNRLDYSSDIFENDELKSIGKLLYGVNESCGLMIDRVYVEAPGKNNIYSGIVFIDYYSNDFDNNAIKDIENRISKDYKELFIIIGDCDYFNYYASNIKNNLNKITLDKRIFCMINKFDLYKKNINVDDSIRNEDILNKIKEKYSNYFRLDKSKIIITERFNDIDKKSLKILNSNNEFLRLLKLIKAESNNVCKNIKVRNVSYGDNIISVKLNQERMSVQALVSVLYEKYNEYLVDLWKSIKKELDEDEFDNTQKYFSNIARILLRNITKEYKGYKYKFSKNIVIDFGKKGEEKNEAKKILNMLLNYGYRTVGFKVNENKILIKVNGEISRDDKKKLISAVKGRLQESAVIYFENEFLSTVINKKFKENDFRLALESEDNITIDEFYSAINRAFKKMSENIERYDINIQ